MFKLILYADDSTLRNILCAFISDNDNNNSNSDIIKSELNKVNDWLKLNKLLLSISQ